MTDASKLVFIEEAIDGVHSGELSHEAFFIAVSCWLRPGKLTPEEIAWAEGEIARIAATPEFLEKSRDQADVS